MIVYNEEKDKITQGFSAKKRAERFGITSKQVSEWIKFKGYTADSYAIFVNKKGTYHSLNGQSLVIVFYDNETEIFRKRLRDVVKTIKNIPNYNIVCEWCGDIRLVTTIIGEKCECGHELPKPKRKIVFHKPPTPAVPRRRGKCVTGCERVYYNRFSGDCTVCGRPIEEIPSGD